jgi:hypothetical protein
LPGLLQSLFGYNALQAGLVMSPAGFFALLTLPAVGFVIGRQTDARWVILAGVLASAKQGNAAWDAFPRQIAVLIDLPPLCFLVRHRRCGSPR